jgi:hypothetical protein
MDSNVSIILQNIENEIEHSRRIAETFICALGLVESHYQKRHSELLQPYPELIALSLTDADIAELKQAVIRFIEAVPDHASISAAFWLLSLSRDQTLKEFFVAKLTLYLGWSNPTVVCTLLRALEDLGERVFYTADGAFIGSRSSSDTDTNFGVAKRYLDKYDRAA